MGNTIWTIWRGDLPGNRFFDPRLLGGASSVGIFRSENRRSLLAGMKVALRVKRSFPALN